MELVGHLAGSSLTFETAYQSGHTHYISSSSVPAFYFTHIFTNIWYGQFFLIWAMLVGM